jgi:hypothetical protein
MKKPVTKAKTGAKPKANPSKDYMKPVGGTKQKGYKAPGSNLEKFDSSGKRLTHKYPVGGSATDKNTMLKGIKSLGYTGMAGMSQSLKTGINPTAMKASSGNPKPTTAQLAAGKKASATAKANAAARAKAKAAADKAAKLKAAKTAKKPTTGQYKKGTPG